MKKVTEIEQLKYWMDAEFTILHVMFAIIMLQLVDSLWSKVVLIAYLLISLLYAGVRLAYVAKNDPNYLRVPKK